MPSPPSSEELRKIDAYRRAANYLSVGQIYLYDGIGALCVCAA
jgi:phosphoketolase